MEAALQGTENWISPRTTSGSLLTSLAVHGVMVLVTIALMHSSLFRKERVYEDASFDYEVLNEAPSTAKEHKPGARARSVESQNQDQLKEKVNSEELQDAKSNIAGTEIAAKTQAVPLAQGDGSAPALPYYKIKPKYPQAALVSGYEGWILMKIDITEHGDVENVRVVGGEMRNLFQDEARRAITKWKYRPFLDGKGNPVRKADHEVRVDFKLQDA